VNTCRLCKKAEYKTPNENLIKYGVRHYVHLSCALTKWGNTFLDGLHDHQIGQLPFMVLDRFDGALEYAQQRLAKLKGTKS
jgi:hypothetical protein